ncbi:unnamed protein product [Thelazia callipaeda]|uniref:IBB domain-containing protein n=1 Tax=Thelazia callipaeda TaxID=103827 RepID=A0A0N5DC14_THECL|nr:unnamed protein product [Thelazia callipaeda]
MVRCTLLSLPLLNEGMDEPLRKGMDKEVLNEGVEKEVLIQGPDNEGMDKEILSEGMDNEEMDEKVQNEGMDKEVLNEGIDEVVKIEGIDNEGMDEEVQSEGMDKKVLNEGTDEVVKIEGMDEEVQNEGMDKKVLNEGIDEVVKIEGMDEEVQDEGMDKKNEGMDKKVLNEGIDEVVKIEGMDEGMDKEVQNEGMDKVVKVELMDSEGMNEVQNKGMGKVVKIELMDSEGMNGEVQNEGMDRKVVNEGIDKVVVIEGMDNEGMDSEVLNEGMDSEVLNEGMDNEVLNGRMDEDVLTEENNQRMFYEEACKFVGITSDVLRKRREETCAAIRAEQRQDDLNRRRQINHVVTANEEREAVGFFIDAYYFNSHQIQIDRFPICTGEIKRVGNDFYGVTYIDIEQILYEYNYRLREGNAGEIAEEIVHLNLVPHIIELLRTGAKVHIHRTAVYIISTIVALSTAHTAKIVANNAIPYLINLIGSEDRETRELTLFALANIISESPMYRDACIRWGIAPKIAAVCNKFSVLCRFTIIEARCAVWTASNLCRGNNPPVDINEIAILLPLFSEALHSSDSLILLDACRAFNWLFESIPMRSFNCVVKPTITQRLVNLIAHQNPKISLEALLAVGNIILGGHFYLESVVSCCNSMVNIHNLLREGDQETKREVCWVLSNIISGAYSHTQIIFDNGIIPSLLKISKTQTFHVRVEACYVICKIAMSGRKKQISDLVEAGALAPLSDMLTVMDTRVVLFVLAALDRILKCGECYKGHVGLF